jgi:hypothetical protein
MRAVETLWIPCTIENAGFSGERRYEVELGEQGKVVGVADVQYLQTEAGDKLGDDIPPYGETIKGRVECRATRRPDDTYNVEFPGSDIFHVPKEALTSLKK